MQRRPYHILRLYIRLRMLLRLYIRLRMLLRLYIRMRMLVEKALHILRLCIYSLRIVASSGYTYTHPQAVYLHSQALHI